MFEIIGKYWTNCQRLPEHPQTPEEPNSICKNEVTNRRLNVVNLYKTMCPLIIVEMGSKVIFLII